MDNPAPTDVAIQLSAIAWLVLVIVVVLSLGLALLCRPRYVAAVVRLQGRSQVQRNESWSAAPTVPPLRLVVEELADGARPHVAGRILRLRHTILASQLARDVVFWCGFIVLWLFGPALIPALLHAIRTGDTSVLRAVIGLLSLAFSSDFSFSPVWVTLAFSVMWLVVPPILVIATQTAVRPKHVYVPVAAVVAAWVAETMRISWFVAPIAVVLLDLREYKASHAGTRYEIYQLMNVVSVDRVIVLLGSAEDTNAISTELYRAWAAMVESSPNRRLVHPELQLCRMRSGSPAEVKTLFLRIHARAMNASPPPAVVARPA